ncbi:MAG: glycosyltransferase [Deltaproteobacteria bacterium]|nr:glycosyltransferase [Deltaproteobacteria bacterium]
MRIVDVSESYSPQGGGVRTYVHAKLRAAAALGHDVTIVAPGTSDEEQTVPGGRILRIKSPRSPFDARYGVFVSPRPVHAAMLALQPDLVEGSSPWLGGHIAGTYPGDAKRVMVFHTDPVAVWAQTLLSPRLGFGSVDRLMMPAWQAFRRMSAKFDGTVVSGLWLARRLLSQGFRRPLVVPFGIDKSRFDAAARSEDMRTELLAACGLGPDAQLVAVVGRLDPEKRIGTLIRAFDRARRHRPMGLVIFGRGALAPIYGAMAKRVPGVHMAGFVDTPERMSTALASADAFLHGGAAETYGMAVAESICAGVPVVVPDVGGANALYGAPGRALQGRRSGRRCGGAAAPARPRSGGAAPGVRRQGRCDPVDRAALREPLRGLRRAVCRGPQQPGDTAAAGRVVSRRAPRSRLPRQA